MTGGELAQALVGILDAGAVEEHEPVEIDGVPVGLTVHPADGEALAAVLELLTRTRGAAVVRGGGTRLGFGHPPSRADLVLSTGRLAGVIDFDPGEGVCHVRGGTRLADLRPVVKAEGWELPLEPPGDASTVGGAIASAAVGPRTLGFGPPRDLVLGLEVVLANGERTHCGGRVVKNVTGYDLNKLYTGSFGTLGVIEGTWLRLRPLPERTAVYECATADLHDACRQAVASARRASARAAALWADARPGMPLHQVVELAGEDESVGRDAAWIEAELGARPGDDALLARVGDRQAEVRGAGGLRFRIAALPSRLEPTIAELSRSGASVLCYPGLGLVYAGYDLGSERDESAVDSAFRRVARVAREAGGAFLCEAAPSWAKQGRDVFGALGVALPLIKTLKAGFDPEGVLNPGRFVGRV